MKKLLTLRNILVWGGALLALVAFFVAFGASLSYEGSLGSETYCGLILGKRVAITGIGSSALESEFEYGAPLSTVGIILVLVFGLAAVAVGLFVKAPWAKWVIVGCGVVMIVGAIFVFCMKSSLASDIARDMTADAPEHYQDVYKDCLEELADFKPSFGAIFSGILAVIGGAAVAASQFLPEAK